MPKALAEELSMSMSMPLEVMVLRIVGAAILCGLIGLERELSVNNAGLRTNMLIGVAAAMLCVITLEMMHTLSPLTDASRMDPIRLIEAVTAGVAFLAAGVVVYTRGDVKGLTSGASMWLAGAIGLSAGLGFWPLALLASVLGVVILWTLRQFQVAAGLKDETDDAAPQKDATPREKKK